MKAVKIKLSKEGALKRRRTVRRAKESGEPLGRPLRSAEFIAMLPPEERRLALHEPTGCPCVFYCPSTAAYYLFHGEGGAALYSSKSYAAVAVAVEVRRLTGQPVNKRRRYPPNAEMAQAIKVALRPDLSPTIKPRH